MKSFNEVCPRCGTWNYGLYLEETGGIYECECCKQIIRSKSYGTDLAVERSLTDSYNTKEASEFRSSATMN